jgi:hypothetical protein
MLFSGCAKTTGIVVAAFGSLTETVLPAKGSVPSWKFERFGALR